MFIIAIIEGLEVEYLQTADRTYRQNINKISKKCVKRSYPVGNRPQRLLGKIAGQNPHDFTANRRGKGRTPLINLGETQDVQDVYDPVNALGSAAQQQADGFFVGGRVGNFFAEQFGNGLGSWYHRVIRDMGLKPRPYRTALSVKH
jgi:hypothetical protein